MPKRVFVRAVWVKGGGTVLGGGFVERLGVVIAQSSVFTLGRHRPEEPVLGRGGAFAWGQGSGGFVVWCSLSLKDSAEASIPLL